MGPFLIVSNVVFDAAAAAVKEFDLLRTGGGILPRSGRVWFVSGPRGCGKQRGLRHALRTAAAEWFNCEDPATGERLAKPTAAFAELSPAFPLVLVEATSLPNFATVLLEAHRRLPEMPIFVTSSRFSSLASALGQPKDGLLEKIVAQHCHCRAGSEFEDPPRPPAVPPVRDFGDPTDEELNVSPTLGAKLQPPLERIIRTDLQSHLPKLSPAKAEHLLTEVMLNCGKPLNKVTLAKKLKLGRPYLEQCFVALEECHLLARVYPLWQDARREISAVPHYFPLNLGIQVTTQSIRAAVEEASLWHRFRLHCFLVLRQLYPNATIHYWRNKNGQQLDFVVKSPASSQLAPSQPAVCAAIICSQDGKFDPAPFKHFRKHYPTGAALIMVPSYTELQPSESARNGLVPLTSAGIMAALQGRQAVLPLIPTTANTCPRLPEGYGRCLTELAFYEWGTDVLPEARQQTLVRSCLEEAPSRRRGKVASTQKQKSFRVTQKLQHEFLASFFISEYERALQFEPDLTMKVFLARIVEYELQADQSSGQTPI